MKYKIIDAHSHFINRAVMRDKVSDENFLKNFQNPSIGDGKKLWIEAMDKNNVEKAVFIALGNGNEEFLKFVESSDRFVPTTSVNPIADDAVEQLDRDVKRGCKVLKLYATSEGVDISDERAHKVYEYCEKNKIPILIHFGVTIGRSANLEYGNPLKLSSIVSKFPDLKCVIAHFGAGFFQEALLVMYKHDNVYFDTSGTNNWLDYNAFGWTLKDIFRIALKAIGSKRILFGTDSHRIAEGYRDHILEDQIKILEELLPEEEVQNVLYNNAKEVFDL